MSDNEEIEYEVPLTKKSLIQPPKVKKERSPAQMKAFEEAQRKRQHNIELKKQQKKLEAYHALLEEDNKKYMDMKATKHVEIEQRLQPEYRQSLPEYRQPPNSPVHKYKKPIKKQVEEDDESSDEEIIVVKSQKKKKPKKKTVIIESSDSSSDDSSDSEPKPKHRSKKAQPVVRRKAPEKQPEEENYKPMKYFPANDFFV